MKLDLQATWLVIGAGVSGLGAAALLRAKGVPVIIYDDKEPPTDRLAAINKLGANFFVGPPSNLPNSVKGCVLSPSITSEHPIYRWAVEKKLVCLSEVDLALSFYQGEAVAITGTNGKSTTCLMVEHMLKAEALAVKACGNIGVTPSELLAAGEKPAYLALELSSYQLEQSQTARFAAAIFTNFSFDHLARHKDLQSYFAAKWKVFGGVKPGGAKVMTSGVWLQAEKFGFALNKDEKAFIVSTMQSPMPPMKGGVAVFHVEHDFAVYSANKKTLLAKKPGFTAGFHNFINGVCAALACHEIAGKSLQSLMDHLDNFSYLPYRYEKVGEVAGYPIINDSKSTNVDSTLCALQNMTSPCFLLVGGQGKGESFTPLQQHADRIKAAICFGASGQEVYNDLRGIFPCSRYPTLKEALLAAKQLLHKEPAPLLFSPACASFDEFRNFEDRGTFFNSFVSEHLLKA